MAAARFPTLCSPIEEMNRVLDRAPPVCTEILKDETRLTGRWLHGCIHDRTAPMSDLSPDPRELLLDPGKPVTEIAVSIGYQTPSAFSTAFRAVEGISPSEFRRRI